MMEKRRTFVWSATITGYLSLDTLWGTKFSPYSYGDWEIWGKDTTEDIISGSSYGGKEKWAWFIYRMQVHRWVWSPPDTVTAKGYHTITYNHITAWVFGGHNRSPSRSGTLFQWMDQCNIHLWGNLPAAAYLQVLTNQPQTNCTVCLCQSMPACKGKKGKERRETRNCLIMSENGKYLVCSWAFSMESRQCSHQKRSCWGCDSVSTLGDCYMRSKKLHWKKSEGSNFER